MAARVKSKTVRKTLVDEDVLSAFHSVLGTDGSSVSLKAAWPKYERLRRHTDRFVRALEALRDSAPMAKAAGAPAQEALAAYAAGLRQQHGEVFTAPDMAPYADAPDAAPAAEGQRFADVYAKVKACNLVNLVVMACRNLAPYKAQLADSAALRDRFLRGAGLTFAPLPELPQLNFKQLYGSPALSADDRHVLLVVLHKAYQTSYDVYEAASASDVDVEEFATLVMSSMGEVKKLVPRCDDAFRKIEESVDLLKGKFDGYYGDYVASGNPTIIMENFVLDVSKDTDTSPKVTAQFRKIIGHYRKVASSQAQDPKLKAVFGHIDRNFKALAKSAGAPAEDTAEPTEAVAEEAPEDADEGVALDAPAEARRLEAEERTAGAAAAAQTSPTTDGGAPGAAPGAGAGLAAELDG